MKQKTRFKNFGNIVSATGHDWPVYRYRPQKSHIGRPLCETYDRCVL